MQKQVEKKIEKEFDSSNIKSLIQSAATEAAIKQIDIPKIKDIIDSEVDKLVEVRVKDLMNQIELLKSENEKALDNLSILADLNLALNNAAHQMKYLIKLKELSENQDVKVAFTARQCLDRTLEEIKRNYDRLNIDYWGYKHVDDQYFGLKSTKGWKLEDYVSHYKNVTGDTKVVYVNKYLSNSNNDETSKFKFSYFILKEESNPEIVYTICAFVDSKARLKRDYLFDSEIYLKWLKSKL